MQAEVVIFAVGNRSRGDDALGPLLFERLQAWLAETGRSGEYELIDDYQLQIEHALDLQGRRLVLFIDAGSGTPAPYAFYPVGPAATAVTHSTHALPPEAVLAVYRQVIGEEPPPAFVLCVRGERFELGEGLSAPALAHAEAAWRQLTDLCGRAESAAWQRCSKDRSNSWPATWNGTAFLSSPPLAKGD